MFGVGVLTGASLNVSQTHSLGRFSCITKNAPRQVLMLFDYSVQTLHRLEFLLCQNLLRAGYGSPSLWGTCKSWGCSRLCQLAEGPGGPAGSQGWLECRHPPNTPSLAFCLLGDWSQLLTARARSDAVSVWQCWVAPEGLCWR